jgi:hypothetical protein
MLAYGTAGDATDEYCRLADSTAQQALGIFCTDMIHLFGPTYLRKPTAEDITRISKYNELHRGMPGLIGSLDCMHWEWKNCPKAWKGQYQGIYYLM